MNKTEFFEKYGVNLVVSCTDSPEFGDYLFLHPEEIDIVKQYDNNKFQVVSVHETEDGNDFIDLTEPCDFGEQHHKYGYFVIAKK